MKQTLALFDCLLFTTNAAAPRTTTYCTENGCVPISWYTAIEPPFFSTLRAVRHYIC